MTFLTVSSTPASPNFRNPLNTDVATALITNRRVFLRVVTRHIGSTETTENILQRFYLRTLSKASDFQNRESILQWLFRELSSVTRLPIVALRNGRMSPLPLLATMLQQREKVSVSIRPDSRLYQQAFHLTDRPRMLPDGWQS